MPASLLRVHRLDPRSSVGRNTSGFGVTAQIESDTGGNDGVGFAIPSDTIRSVVPRLVASGSAA
jgi:S1-C subfamily serine protease